MGERKRRIAAGGAAGAALKRGGDQAARELAARARAHAAARQFGRALDALASALESAPQVDALWAQFGELIRFFRLRDPLTGALRALLARALEHPAVDPCNLVLPIVTTALSRA